MLSLLSVLKQKTTLFLFVFAVLLGASVPAKAQFSKAVCLLKGSVYSNETGEPVSVKVSVRPVNDTAQEIVGSRSNSETGNYLVVVKPGKKYWVHLESEYILPKDTLVEIPASDKTIQIVHDFVVTSTGAGLLQEANRKANGEETPVKKQDN